MSLRRLFPTLLLLACCVRSHADSTVVFNELMYHPASSETQFEWLELHNQMSVDMELSGWKLSGGVSYQFPQGTILNGGGYLVVALNPGAIRQATGITNVLGPFSGRLSNSGERIDLVSNNGRTMDSVNYGTDGAWPTAPDGAGVSLAKLNPNALSRAARNWHWSEQAGGTPGTRNFAASFVVSPALLFNELPAASATPFWIELRNASTNRIVIEGVVVRSAGDVDADYVIPSGKALEPGELVVFTQADLGFRPATGDSLFLISSNRLSVSDAVVVRTTPQARSTEPDRRWLLPDPLTQGNPNRFQLRDEVVINEIMYHHRPILEQPGVSEERLLVAIDAEWTFDQSGRELGTNWVAADYDDSSWAQGRGLLFKEDSALPGPKNTPLSLTNTSGARIITYYFRKSFVLDRPPQGSVLTLNPIVDDGAVFYLNGHELFRLNIPDGPLDSTTLAQPGVDNAVYSGPFELPSSFLVSGTNILAVEVHQGSSTSSDVVFGTELSASIELSPARPFQESGESWIELFNRSADAVDLTGWSLDEGIEFGFPAGTTIAAGGYLVVAKDADLLRGVFPDATIMGNFTNRLSHRSDRIVLRDSASNPADEVEYFDDAPWPAFGDGDGSSIELRNPFADNSRPEAWASSDEASKSAWLTVSYRGPANQAVGPTRWNEFIIGLLISGEILIDDVSVIESPDTPSARELIQNGTFESGAAKWRLLGNHRRGGVIVDPSNSANRVLHVIASGPTEHMHNHIETTLAGNTPIVSGREYRISFKAKWLGGSSQLHTRLYFNHLARTTLLPVPQLNGTPGARNSRFETNTGPTFSQLAHVPVVPAANQAVTISVRAADPDGVAACDLLWNAGSGWSRSPMTLTDAGAYTATVPGRAASTVVQFYVEATDGRAAKASYPSAGTDSRALYKVNDGLANLTRLHNVRIIMTAADAAFLHASTNVMSNEALGATVIYDEREVFYDVGVHLQASQRGRNDASRVGFTIQFNPDHLFRGVHDTITIDRSGGYSGRGGKHDEIILRHVMNQAGDLPDMYNDFVRIIAPTTAHTGTGMLLMTKYGDEFLDALTPNGSDGTAFKLELVYYPLGTTDGNPESPKLPQPDDVIGTDIRDLGPDKEAYRWTLLIESNRDHDNYAPIIELARALSLSGTALDARSSQVIDVDQWLRAFALKSLSGDADTYSFGYPHNQMLHVGPDRLARALPWDMDYSWARAYNSGLIGGDNVAKLISLPSNRRTYYGHLEDIISTSFNTAYLSRWATHYAGLVGQNFSGVLTYIGQRGDYVKSQFPARVPFQLSAGQVADFMVDQSTVTLNGSGWINISTIQMSGAGSLPVVWNAAMTNWQATVPLVLGTNIIELLAFDFHQRLVASNRVSVTSTAISGAADSDADGMPDAWERTFGLNTEFAEANLDPDQDGASNFAEYLAGTDPLNSSSRLTLQISPSQPGEVEVTFNAIPGRSYTLESTDRIGGVWSPIANVAAQIKDRSARVPNVSDARERFYRIVTPARR